MEKQINQISFDYNGKHYVLEYTRESVKRMEAAGYRPNESGSTPLMELDMLWAGAFYKNHRQTSSRILEKILDEMKDKDKLLQTLRQMVTETYNSLVDPDEEDSGNVEWTATI